MKIRRAILLALLGTAFVVAHPAHATDEESWNQSAKAAIQQKYSNARVEYVQFGELSPGLPVVACVVVGEHGYWVSIMAKQQGRMQEWKRTPEISSYQRYPEPYIEKHSLFILDFSNSLDYGWNTTDQYQLRNGELVRIGREYSGWSPLHPDQPGRPTSSKESINYLTGLKRWTKKNGKVRTHGEERLPRIALKRIEAFEGIDRTDP